jgi:iron complex outermembrane receptor protein
MAFYRPVATGLVLSFTISSLAFGGQGTGAQQTQQSGSAPPQGAAAQTPPAPQAQAKPPAKPEEQKITRKEDVVVSASKTEQQLVDAPATMSVINEKMLEMSPSGSYADVLRSVPGTNITQISSRDINVNQRGATSSLATGQLTVVDGRSVYLDFFGFTMWEFVPNDFDQVKQIEVIRGPASAIWGANALTGVVSFITKTPREMAGESMTFGLGTFETAVNHNGRGERHAVLRARQFRAGGERPVVVPGRRGLLRHRSAGAPDRAHSQRRNDPVSHLCERRHRAAARRRPRRL